MQKHDILEKIEKHYSALLEILLSRLAEGDDQTLKPGEWGAKDVLAHIAAWEDVLLRFHIGGEPFEEVIGMPGARYHGTTFEDINAHLFAKYGSWRVEEVRQFADDTHHAVLRKLETLSEQEYREPAESIAAIGLDPYPLYEYIAANTFDHYVEHMENLKE